MIKIVLYLFFSITFFANAQINKKVLDTEKIKSKKSSTFIIIGQPMYKNISLYHFSLFDTQDKSHIEWLKINDRGFYHLGYYLRYLDNNSLEWLKKNNQGFYYYSQMLLDDSDSASSIWLKKNNIGLLHLGNYLRYEVSTSLKWLKNNNVQLYHLANQHDYDTRQASLLWLKEH